VPESVNSQTLCNPVNYNRCEAITETDMDSIADFLAKCKIYIIFLFFQTNLYIDPVDNKQKNDYNKY